MKGAGDDARARCVGEALLATLREGAQCHGAPGGDPLGLGGTALCAGAGRRRHGVHVVDDWLPVAAVAWRVIVVISAPVLVVVVRLYRARKCNRKWKEIESVIDMIQTRREEGAMRTVPARAPIVAGPLDAVRVDARERRSGDGGVDRADICRTKSVRTNAEGADAMVLGRVCVRVALRVVDFRAGRSKRLCVGALAMDLRRHRALRAPVLVSTVLALIAAALEPCHRRRNVSVRTVPPGAADAAEEIRSGGCTGKSRSE